MILDDARQLDALDFSRSGGLLPVVAQNALTGEVLMLAFANREALERTLRDRRMWYFSRTRQTLWLKGETTGNHQRVVSLHADCDTDSVLALVVPEGPTCHTGERTCFGAAPTLRALADVIAERARSPRSGSYTSRLLGDQNLRLKKLGEEAVELALACKEEANETAAAEAADLIYHVLVACAAEGVTLDDILGALDARRSSAPPPHEQAVHNE
ncbi:MAG: bifunctional phosphoribosyl-AMP cyclohydrolase/phosphoribosyl-ATP diphosphatase HisIE [Longimicrobiales bacterium]